MADNDADSRRRMVAGAADMISRRGLTATSVRELAKHAHSPLGSTYHHFPGGKQQLVTEAVQFTGKWVADALAAELAAGSIAGLRAFLALWRDIVVRSDFRAGCPVLAVSIEEPLPAAAAPLDAAAEAFRSWEGLLAEALRADGVAAPEADRLATVIVAAVEGTVAMCRAQRSIETLDRVAVQLEHTITAAIGHAHSPRSSTTSVRGSPN